MPECHKCKFNGKNSVACLTCKGPDEDHPIGWSSSRKARAGMVSLDAMTAKSGMDKADHTKIGTLTDLMGQSRSFNCSDEEESAVRRALAFLAACPDSLALLFLARMRGETATAAAKRLGVTRRNLNYAIEKLRVREPKLAELFGTFAALPENFDKNGTDPRQEEFDF